MKEVNLKRLHGQYVSNYMTFWKRQNYGDSKKIYGGQWLGWESDEYVQHRGFLGQGDYSVWYHNKTCLFTYVSKPIEWTISKMTANVNLGLHLITVCQCRFISCNKYTLWGRYNGERVGEILEMSLLSTQFCCEPKTAIKNKS